MFQKIIIGILILLLLMTTGLSFAEVKDNSQLDCLASNIYFEARGESIEGKLAVAIVTLNRVVDKRWPNTICEVVYQPRQFSWTHDGLTDKPNNISLWEDSKYLANIAINLHKVKNSNHYHNNTVFPDWAQNDFEDDYIGFLDNHFFYNK